MGQENPVPRVSGGVPWWLWLLALTATAGVVLMIVADREVETTAEIFDRAVKAIDRADGQTVAQCLASLEQMGGADDQVAILKGVTAGATDRDPRSIEILAPYIDHPNDQYRRLAIKFSARSHQKMGNSEQARLLHEKYAEIDPSDPSPHLLLLQLYLDAGALDAARDAAQVILELQPENRNAREAIAMIQAVTGEADEAKQLYRDLLKTEGDRAAASPDTIKNYLNTLLKTGETDTALEFTQENLALVTDPAIRIELYIRSNQLDEAEEVLTGLQLAPENPLFLELRGGRAINDGDWELAVGLLTQAALQMPRSIPVFERLEYSARNNNQPELAEACRDNLDAIHELEQQLENAARAIGSDMKDPELRIRVAEIAEELGRPTVARQWLNSAARVAPDRQIEIQKRLQSLVRPDRLLVPIGAAFTESGDDSDDVPQQPAGDSDGEEPASGADEAADDGSTESSGENALVDDPADDGSSPPATEVQEAAAE